MWYHGQRFKLNFCESVNIFSLEVLAMVKIENIKINFILKNACLSYALVNNFISYKRLIIRYR